MTRTVLTLALTFLIGNACLKPLPEPWTPEWLALPKPERCAHLYRIYLDWDDASADFPRSYALKRTADRAFAQYYRYCER